MAFTEFEIAEYDKLVATFISKRRPPENIRDEVDLAYRITDQSIVIFEIRPTWSDKSVKIEENIAKTTYVRKHNYWKVFWMRADLKWHVYQPESKVSSLEEFLKLVTKDEFCCFWG